MDKRERIARIIEQTAWVGTKFRCSQAIADALLAAPDLFPPTAPEPASDGEVDIEELARVIFNSQKSLYCPWEDSIYQDHWRYLARAAIEYLTPRSQPPALPTRSELESLEWTTVFAGDEIYHHLDTSAINELIRVGWAIPDPPDEPSYVGWKERDEMYTAIRSMDIEGHLTDEDCLNIANSFAAQKAQP